MNAQIDTRSVLPTIRVPTLVEVNAEEERWIASQIPGATYVELPSDDHLPWIGDSDGLLDEVQEFLTGARRGPDPDRVLATVLFTDIVGSTERAAALGDGRWRELAGSGIEFEPRGLHLLKGVPGEWHLYAVASW